MIRRKTAEIRIVVLPKLRISSIRTKSVRIPKIIFLNL